MLAISQVPQRKGRGTRYQVNKRGERKDLAEFAQKILSREDCSKGVVRVPYINPKKQNVKKDTDLAFRVCSSKEGPSQIPKYLCGGYWIP